MTGVVVHIVSPRRPPLPAILKPSPLVYGKAAYQFANLDKLTDELRL
jgi:hypothetical protein